MVLTRTYVERGSLRVDILPQDVSTAAIILELPVLDSLWSIGNYGIGTMVDEKIWHRSGETIPNLAVGSYSLFFYDVPGWNRPATMSITIEEGEDAQHIGEYTEVEAYAIVTLEPDLARMDGAQWRVDDGPWRASGLSSDALTYGEHIVRFLDVPPWITPGQQTINVLSNHVFELTALYREVTGIYVEIEPIEAVNEGAQWRIGSINWTNSGSLIQVDSGIYYVEFSDVPGWTTPIDIMITVTNGETTKVVGNYYKYEEYGAPGTAVGRFDGPRGIDIDSQRQVYISDTGNNRIQILNTIDYSWETPIGSSGTGAGQFDEPFGIFIDDNDTLYVADGHNNRIQRRTSTGSWTVWGGTAAGTSAGQFHTPVDVTVDSSGNIYVADRDNSRIQKRTTDGTWSVLIDSGFNNDQVYWPAGVYVENDMYLLVTDYDPFSDYSQIRRFDLDGAFLRRLGSSASGEGNMNNPKFITSHNTTNVYVADKNNSRILFGSDEGMDWHTLIGSNVLTEAEGVSIEERGYIYITDTGNDRIIKMIPPNIHEAAETVMDGVSVEAGGELDMSWYGESGWYYSVQYCECLLSGAWLDVPGAGQFGTNGQTSVSVTNNLATNIFYRVIAK